jgi:LmbE family N-acetylglucosaminyl deacetylase
MSKHLVFSNRGTSCSEELTVERLKELDPEYIFFPFWSNYIPPEIYENFECVIFHTSDLPKGRGAHPIQNLILRGVETTKICALRCSKEIDAGDIYLKCDVDISYGTADEIYDRIECIIHNKMIPYILKNKPTPTPQEGKPTYYEKIGTRNIADFIRIHPDDIELGCYGTLEKLKDDGYEIERFVIGLGRGDELDNKFDVKPLLHWVQIIEKELQRIKPDIIFTHCRGDLNLDHRIIHDAVLIATRPMYDEKVRDIYLFEILSSTEWTFPTSFSPNVFYDITGYVGLKKDILTKEFADEMREYPHPRSLRGVEVLAQTRGMQVGVEYAEAFELARMIR